MKKTAGVMGWPLSHSLSPRLHGYWIDKYKLNAGYAALPVRPEDLEAVLRRLPAESLQKGEIFRGTNLTIPLKETAMDIVDVLDPSARRIGAVNTIVLGESGEMIGRNTDGVGFMDSLNEHPDVAALQGGTAVLVGTGGAARAVAVALVDMGFARILMTNRTRERAENLAAHIGEKAEVVDWHARSDCLAEADFLVNTTSLGMSGQPSLDLPLDALKATAIVTDIIYAPQQTELLKAAKLRGNETIEGIGMLLHQAKAGFEAWFGTRPEVDAGLRDHVLEGLKGNE
ncbi:shikimate dehydrogenase [Sneathiella marina]|uniref:Shikimate dehydrogenase (NADP(+)) n=1 Tax=Sneathiella marina TaxID=2950108 RepID=A0ABY4W9S1_9PROT|nr:shikimate dehydrogenase [Sneathiella marina]USG61391.1 shikimate dehydrogenase [Sneathiella marina]